MPSARAVLCDPRRPICPKCGSALPRTSLFGGQISGYCEAQVRKPGSNQRENCKQHIYLAVDGDVCWSIPLTSEQLAKVNQYADKHASAPSVGRVMEIARLIAFLDPSSRVA